MPPPLACSSASPRPSPYPLPPAGLSAPPPHSAVYKPRKEGLKTTKFTVSAQPLPEESFNLCRGGAHTAALKPGPPGACLSTCLTRWPVRPTGWTPDSGYPLYLYSLLRYLRSRHPEPHSLPPRGNPDHPLHESGVYLSAEGTVSYLLCLAPYSLRQLGLPCF